MALHRLRDEIEEIVVVALGLVASEEDTVTYDVTIERIPQPPQDDSEYEGFETRVLLYVGIDCPEIDGRTFTHMSVPVASFTDPGYVRHMMTTIWDRLMVQRMAERLG